MSSKTPGAVVIPVAALFVAAVIDDLRTVRDAAGQQLARLVDEAAGRRLGNHAPYRLRFGPPDLATLDYLVGLAHVVLRVAPDHRALAASARRIIAHANAAAAPADQFTGN